MAGFAPPTNTSVPYDPCGSCGTTHGEGCEQWGFDNGVKHERARIADSILAEWTHGERMHGIWDKQGEGFQRGLKWAEEFARTRKIREGADHAR